MAAAPLLSPFESREILREFRSEVARLRSAPCCGEARVLLATYSLRHIDRLRRALRRGSARRTQSSAGFLQPGAAHDTDVVGHQVDDRQPPPRQPSPTEFGVGEPAIRLRHRAEEPHVARIRFEDMTVKHATACGEPRGTALETIADAEEAFFEVGPVVQQSDEGDPLARRDKLAGDLVGKLRTEGILRKDMRSIQPRRPNRLAADAGVLPEGDEGRGAVPDVVPNAWGLERPYRPLRTQCACQR